MLLKYFYDKALAHASYMVGCQKTGEALIVDPGRDIDQYIAAAAQEGMTIVGAAETHIHADYVSGARELADRFDVTLYISDEGPADWKYLYAPAYNHQLLKDGDPFMIGNIKFETLHTPGHTPESISFILTDMGGGATEPMGIFTGDFLFVGSIGRPDLLEKAAGVVGNADEGARAMFNSIQRLKALPDYLQVWPAHGAGSACGKGLGAIPSTTVGYEKRFNPALRYADEETFVDYLLADQPEAPKYFAVMKKVNKEGPLVLGEKSLPSKVDIGALAEIASSGQMMIDTAASVHFAQGHVPGSINLPLGFLAGWAGWFVNYDEPIYLITTPRELPEAVRILHKIGVDDIAGYFDAAEVAASQMANQAYETATPQELAADILAGNVVLVDVRADTEWNAGHIPNAQHLFLGTLPETAAQVVNGKTIVVNCRSGARSAVGASILQAAGAQKVVNLAGGILAWQKADLPTS